MKEQMSITRALNELKLLDKRIDKTIRATSFISYEINKKVIDKEFTPKEDLQSIEDLIQRRQTIKSKIMESNAVTKVEISGKTMTVVEAIEMKDSIKYKKQLCDRIISDVRAKRSKIEDINEVTQGRLDSLLQANFGKESKTKDSETEAIAKPFLERNEAKEIDPIGIDKYYGQLQEEIDNFESEVDFILSESNALTKIEI